MSLLTLTGAGLTSIIMGGTIASNATSITDDQTAPDMIDFTEWSNPGNAQTQNDTDATNPVTVAFPDNASSYLKALNYGDFSSIADGATIDLVTVYIRRKLTASGAQTVNDHVVKLVKGGTVSGNNKADLVTDYTDSYSIITYSYTPAQWGVTLTGADVKATDFGCVFSCKVTEFCSGVSVDHIYMEITYS